MTERANVKSFLGDDGVAMKAVPISKWGRGIDEPRSAFLQPRTLSFVNKKRVRLDL